MGFSWRPSLRPPMVADVEAGRVDVGLVLAVEPVAIDTIGAPLIDEQEQIVEIQVPSPPGFAEAQGHAVARRVGQNRGNRLVGGGLLLVVVAEPIRKRGQSMLGAEAE